MPKTKTSGKKRRVSMSLPPTQLDQLTQLAELSGQTPTTYSTELVNEQLRQAIAQGRIPVNVEENKRERDLLHGFVFGLVNAQEISDALIAEVATVIGCPTQSIIDTFFWEETEEDAPPVADISSPVATQNVTQAPTTPALTH